MKRRTLLGAGAAGLAGASTTMVALAGGVRAAGAQATDQATTMKLGCQQGPTDERRLRYFARHGVKNICGDLRERKSKGPFTVDELARLRDLAAGHGVSVDMVRLPFLRPSHIDGAARPAIMLGQSPERDRDIEEVQNSIVSCARARIPAISYNLTLIGYQRGKPVPGRGGVLQSAWRLRDQGEMAARRTRAGTVSAALFWERIDYFLERVVPVATEHKVRLCCHPHDPPTPPGFQGVDSVLGTVDGLKKFVTLRESPYHVLNFCQGTVAEMLEDPRRQLFDVIRYFGRKQKIFNVHFRNISGKRDDFVERFPDDGDIDFVKAMRVYQEVGYRHMIMPDHVPGHADDPDKLQAFAFSYGYIRALIQAVQANQVPA
jgi:mannonate dehydratase